ncbi:capsular polysaccharide synthesis protein, partial [Rosenbergiella epipactidis]|uniref:capsular polysaccharide synthesis protein n=1 Tax=Rosenbergiella epipactidis TaxID=1544694 RepID=UPI001F502103
MLLKENLIFNIASKLLQSHFKHDANAIAVWSDSGSDNNIVWSVWLQGENEAPDLVKRCFDSIRKNHLQELKVIDLENLNQYLIINPKILDKYKSGIISNTSFSEIIRLELLSNYGGLWVDSTIFCYKPMPNLFESNLSFLTLKGKASYIEGDPLGAIPVFFIFCHSGY